MADKVEARPDSTVSLAQKINAGLMLDLPIFLWGSPGVGKTTSVYDACEHLNMDCHALVANTYEPTYFGGYPFVKDGDIVMAKPKFIDDLEQYTRPVGLFMDEFPTTPRPTQNTLLRVILERRAGNWKLNDNTRIIAAGNFIDVAGNSVLSPAMANRFLHIFHTPKVDEWIGSLSGNIPIGFQSVENWQDDIKYYTSLVVDFAETYYKAQPEYFQHLPTRFEKIQDHAFSTPRSLTAAAKILSLCFTSDLTLCKELLGGMVGQSTTAALLRHISSKDKLDKFPKIDVSDYKFSKDPSQVTVLLRSAAMYAAEKEYCEKAIALFALAHKAGFMPPILRYGSTLAKNIVKSGHPEYTGPGKQKNLILKLPFITEIITADMRK